jgi:hypothetical protein
METIKKFNKQGTNSDSIIKLTLTPQQQHFCQHVASGKNQSDSYNLAYPRSLKWKGDVVRINASRLMSKANIKLTVENLQAAHARRNEMTLDKVLKNMAEWLEFDPLDLMDENDCVKSMKDLAPNVRKSLASIEVVELWSGKGEAKRKIGELKKIRFVDKRATADMHLRVFGAYAKEPLIGKDDMEVVREILKDIL